MTGWHFLAAWLVGALLMGCAISYSLGRDKSDLDGLAAGVGAMAIFWPLTLAALALYQPLRLAHWLGARSARAGKGGGK